MASYITKAELNVRLSGLQESISNLNKQLQILRQQSVDTDVKRELVAIKANFDTQIVNATTQIRNLSSKINTLEDASVPEIDSDYVDTRIVEIYKQIANTNNSIRSLMERISLPNTIANILTNHNLAVHTALGLFDKNGGEITGDVEITDNTKGIILKSSPNGIRYRITIDDNGVLSTTPL